LENAGQAERGRQDQRSQNRRPEQAYRRREPPARDRLSPANRRRLEILNALVVLALLAFLAWYGITFAVLSGGRPLPMIGISEGIATAALPVGFGLMFITILDQLVMRWRRIGDPDAPSPRDVM
jgi:TRAP-type C4-dicarboxylate transport system permease small subunit